MCVVVSIEPAVVWVKAYDYGYARSVLNGSARPLCV